MGVQGPRPRGNPNWNAAADLTWLRGNHNFKAGFQILQISRLQKNQFGQLDFTNEPTRDPNATTTTGDFLATALLGLPSQIRGFVPDLGFIDFRTSTYSAYVQDQWTIKPNLTLTYGLRYDYVTRAFGENGTFQSGPDLSDRRVAHLPRPDARGLHRPDAAPLPARAAPADPVQPVHPGHRGHQRRAEADHGQLGAARGPRLADQPQDGPSHRLRAHVGLDGLAQPVRPAPVRDVGMAAGLRLRHGHDQHDESARSGPDGRVLLVARDRAAPSAALERHRRLLQRPRPQERVFAPVARRAPEGDHPRPDGGPRLRRQLQRPHGVRGPRLPPAAAAIDPATGRRLTAAERDALRPWPHITTDARYSNDIGMSKYNALQVKVQRRFANGLASMLSYTWSHGVDTSSGWFGVENGIGGRARCRTTGTSTTPRERVGLRHPAHPDLGDDLGAAVRPGQALAPGGRPFLDPRQLAAQLDGARPLRTADDGHGGRRSRQHRLHRLRAGRPGGRPAAWPTPRPTSGSTPRRSRSPSTTSEPPSGTACARRATGTWTSASRRTSPSGRAVKCSSAWRPSTSSTTSTTATPRRRSTTSNFGRITTMNGRPRQLQFGLRLVF